jgi:hypothetical protein
LLRKSLRIWLSLIGVTCIKPDLFLCICSLDAFFSILLISSSGSSYWLVNLFSPRSFFYCSSWSISTLVGNTSLSLSETRLSINGSFFAAELFFANVWVTTGSPNLFCFVFSTTSTSFLLL